MNARQRREFAEIQTAGGSVEVYPFRFGSALLRLLGVGRWQRRVSGSVVYLSDRRSQ